MSLKLWPDDVRPAPEGWTWVKTAEEALSLLQTGQVTEASLDHDLGCVDVRDTKGILVSSYDNAAKDGTWLAEQMVALNAWPSQHLRIHSQNPVGARRMKQILAPHWRKR